MKLKMVVVDFEIPARVKKWGLRVGIPAAVLLGGGAIAYAGGLTTFTDGQTLHASDLNANFTALQGQIMSPVNSNMNARFPSDSPINPATTPMSWQASSEVGTSSAAGLLSASFPVAFPNGVLSVIPVLGDSNSCGDVPITLANLHGKTETHQLKDLFPRPFDASFI